jgi:serine/threonine-protein kinase HipA
MATERATWPAVDMAIALPDARTFGEVTRDAVLRAGEVLGLPRRVGERELDRMASALPVALDKLVQAIQSENAALPRPARRFLAGEIRLIRTIQHVVAPEMLGRVARR